MCNHIVLSHGRILIEYDDGSNCFSKVSMGYADDRGFVDACYPICLLYTSPSPRD